MDQPRPLDRLLDLFVYAPIGLAVRALEEVPKLAAQGRDRFSSQASLARMVGQMAVAQGRRQVDGLFDRRPGATPDAATPAPPAPAPEPPAVVEDAEVPVLRPELVPDAPPASEVSTTPDAADLPIPGYDSLSASQVVQRLAGLSTEELEAVRSYEQASRGRKTILLRIAQLRAAS